MDIYRKIAILIIVILFSIILWRLIQRRVEIRNEFVEQFTSTGCADGIQKANTLVPKISNMSASYFKKPVNQFYIKSAYGGGFNGTDVCSDMMLYTIPALAESFPLRFE